MPNVDHAGFMRQHAQHVATKYHRTGYRAFSGQHHSRITCIWMKDVHASCRRHWRLVQSGARALAIGRHVLALSSAAATKDVTWHLPLWAMTSLVWCCSCQARTNIRHGVKVYSFLTFLRVFYLSTHFYHLKQSLKLQSRPRFILPNLTNEQHSR